MYARIKSFAETPNRLDLLLLQQGQQPAINGLNSFGQRRRCVFRVLKSQLEAVEDLQQSEDNLALAAGGGIGLFTLDPPPVIVKIRQGAQIQSVFLANLLFELLDFVVLCCFHTSRGPLGRSRPHFVSLNSASTTSSVVPDPVPPGDDAPVPAARPPDAVA